MSAHPQRPKALLILGMHRSGTSAVTRAVNLLGAEIGKNILLPGQGNAEGFWEHYDAARLDHDLLQAFGHAWFDIRRLPADWQKQTASREALKGIKTIIQQELSGHPLVAIKDPRMCLTAPLWIEGFEAAGFEVQCLLMVRDPREVVDSLQAREQWPRAPIFLLWAHYMMEAVLATRTLKRSLITYDQLLEDWRGTLGRVARELELSWPRDEAAASPDIDAFLHARHRHHVAPNSDEASYEGMPAFIAEFYANCLAVAHGGGDWQALDASARTMGNVSDLFTPHLDTLMTQHKVLENQMTAKVQAFESLLKTLVSNAQQKS
jgi:hypothetical protein